MPIFEYRCPRCGGRHEALLARADQAPPPCPQCGAAEVERLISAFAVGRSQVGPAVGRSGPGPCGSPDCACRTH